MSDYDLLIADYEELKRLVESSFDDIEKAAFSNLMASTRARKVMQDVKRTAQKIRINLLKINPTYNKKKAKTQ